MKCLGCDRNIVWDGEGPFAYTCVCDATIFYDENNARLLILPSSLLMVIEQRLLGEMWSCIKGIEISNEIPHTDYYLGKSAHWSKGKQEMYDYLRKKGAIWSWQCPKCRPKTVERTKMQLKKGIYPDKLHPELNKLILQEAKA